MRRAGKIANILWNGWELWGVLSCVGGGIVLNILSPIIAPFYSALSDIWKVLYGVGLFLLMLPLSGLLIRGGQKLLADNGDKGPSQKAKAESGNIQQAINTGSGPQIIAGRDAAGRDIIHHNYAPAPVTPRTLLPRLEGAIKGNAVIVVVWNDDVEAHEFRVNLTNISNGTNFLQSQLPITLTWENSQSQWELIGPGQSANVIVATLRGTEVRNNMTFRVIRVQKLRATKPEMSRLYSTVPFASELECQLELGANIAIEGERISNWILTLDGNGELRTFRQLTPGTPNARPLTTP
jgi:hypothetical protein